MKTKRLMDSPDIENKKKLAQIHALEKFCKNEDWEMKEDKDEKMN